MVDPLRVVVDANIVIASPRLNSGAWRALLSASRAGLVQIFVPEVCVIEAEGWIRREASTRAKELHKAISRMEHIGVRLDQWGMPFDSIDRVTESMVDDYRRYLDGRFDDTATVLPVPNPSHEDLVRRAVGRILPFKEKGTGYRDALIWENVCELAKGGPVVFLTENIKDFATEGELAQDLRDDLRRRGIRLDFVRLQASLVALVKGILPEGHDEIAEIEAVLRTAAVAEQLIDEANMAFGQNGSIPYPSAPNLPDIFTYPESEGAWGAEDITVASANPVEDSSHFVVGHFRTTTRVYEVIPEEQWESLAHTSAAEQIEDVWEREGGTVTICVYRPAVMTFAGTFTPPNSLMNVGVIDIDAPR